MMNKSATRMESSEVGAKVTDFGNRNGLSVGHLRAFVEQANIAGLKDETHVYLTDKLQSSSPYHDTEITASERKSNTVPLDAASEASDG
jgi:hypothetical protein